MKLISLVFILFISVLPLAAQTISTFAGTGALGYTGDGGPVLKATLNNPFGVIRGPDGAIWFCEYDNHVVRRVAADGTVTAVAGSGKAGYSGDGGSALKSTLNRPHEIRFNKSGNLFIADMANHVIRRVDVKSGVITTIAGTGKSGFSGDGGPAINSQLRQPHSIQFDSHGDLFICDIGNHVIRKLTMKTGVITTIAGTGKPGATPDGAPILGTPINGPRSIDFDAAGHLWLATREGNQVFKIDLRAGKIFHIAGTGKKGFTGNGGPAREAALSGPKGIAVAPNGNIYLADTESHSLRMIDIKTGNLELIAGTGEKGDGPDGNPLACKLARLHGLFVDADGSVFIGDSENHRVRILKNRSSQ